MQEAERKQAMKTHIQTQGQAYRSGDASGGKVYRWDADPELSEAERNDPNTVLLALKDFDEAGNRTHGFFSTMPPQDILAHLSKKMAEHGQEFAVSDTTWKVNFECKKQINQEPDEEADEEEKSEFVPVIESAKVQVEIMRVPDRDMRFVQFKRKAGAAIMFYEHSKLYMEQLALFNNATLEEGAV
jgi:hypothetical protein